MDFTGPGVGNLAGLAALGGLPGKRLVAGVVDGRNIWRTDLTRPWEYWPPCAGWPIRSTLPPRARCCTSRWMSSSETDLDPQFAGWLAFARQKLRRGGRRWPRGLTGGVDCGSRRAAGQPRR